MNIEIVCTETIASSTECLTFLPFGDIIFILGFLLFFQALIFMGLLFNTFFKKA